MSPLDFIKKEVEEPVKETPKVAPKAEKITPVQPERTEKSQNIIVHSELDAMLLDRVKSQPKTLDENEVEVIEKPKEGRHQLSLPDELEPYLKKYAFCWIFKRKQSIDEACDQLHYKLTNRLYFPELPDHLFSARGIMERGDNVLAFRPKHIDDEMRKAPGLESTMRIKQRLTAHEGNPDFYVPKPEEGESKVVGV
jgi:hypothetical protein